MRWHACGSVEDREWQIGRYPAGQRPSFGGVLGTLGEGTQHTNVYAVEASVFKA